jgi:hypothetical protein
MHLVGGGDPPATAALSPVVGKTSEFFLTFGIRTQNLSIGPLLLVFERAAHPLAERDEIGCTLLKLDVSL